MTTPFLIRDVPTQLHTEWAFFAKLRGMSMRKYVLHALNTLIEKDKENVPLKKKGASK